MCKHPSNQPAFDVIPDKETFMAHNTNGTGINLSGYWNFSGVVLQVESLPTIHQLETGLEKLACIDWRELSSADMSGRQLLSVWKQCVRLRGVKPELINMPEGMQQTFKRMSVEEYFSDSYMDVS